HPSTMYTAYHKTSRTASAARVLETDLGTITEESQSTVSYIVSVEGDGLQRDLRSVLRKLPSYYNPCRLDAKITELDRYLEENDSVYPCFRQRLREIREIFDAFRERRMERGIPALGHLIQLEREVQIARHAQQNISEFTRLLLKENIKEHVKAAVRTGLYFAEHAATTAFDPKDREVFEELKRSSCMVEQLLRVDPPKSCPATSGPSEAVANADAKVIHRYLEQIFALRYEHIGISDRYCPRFNVADVRPFAAYLEWRITGDKAAGLALAQSQGLHPIELEYVFQPRLDQVLGRLEVDAEYVKARLLNLYNIWSWVNGYNRMAQDGEWSTLAGQFRDDRAAFGKIFPGPLVFCNPDLGIQESNTKGRVYFGIIQLQGRYFVENRGPTQFKLSRTAKKIDRRFCAEQKRSYGGGQGDPKGETPQEQGSNPSAETEHPGPPPPDVGKGTGGGPTKAGEGGHNTQQNSSSEGSSSGQSGANQSSGGPQPKIHSESIPTEESDDVKAHNEDMGKRHDRANTKVDVKEQTVEKGFWKVPWPYHRPSLSSS
ncbi:MAG: hypothetical protein L6R35_007011, partial [Caloplaca aegaea]